MVVAIESRMIQVPWARRPGSFFKDLRPVAAQVNFFDLTISFDKKLRSSWEPNRMFVRLRPIPPEIARPLESHSLELIDLGGEELRVIASVIVEKSGRVRVGGEPLILKSQEGGEDKAVSLRSADRVSISVPAQLLFPVLGPVPESRLPPAREDFFSGCYDDAAAGPIKPVRYDSRLEARLNEKLAASDIPELEQTFLENKMFQVSLWPLIRFANDYLQRPGQSAKIIEKLSILLIGGISWLNSDRSCPTEQQNELAREVISLSLELATHPLEAVRENLKLQIPRLVEALNQAQLAIFQAHLEAK